MREWKKMWYSDEEKDETLYSRCRSGLVGKRRVLYVVRVGEMPPSVSQVRAENHQIGLLTGVRASESDCSYAMSRNPGQKRPLRVEHVLGSFFASCP
jgi:hypothetical protein